MHRLLSSQPQALTSPAAEALKTQREQIKQQLRQKIDAILQTAQDLPPDRCVQAIATGLADIQTYCKTVEKVFIVIEEKITCDQLGLGGSPEDTATLFRGPREDASVAICVTDQGSLLHRGSQPWRIYRNAGDVNPV